MKPSGSLVSWCYQRFCMVNLFVLFNYQTGAPITTGIVVFISTIISISISRSLYSGCFSVVFREILLSVGTDISMSWQVFFLVFHFDASPVDLNFFINLDSHMPNHSSFNVFVAVAGSSFIVSFFGFNDTQIAQWRYPAILLCFSILYSDVAKSLHSDTRWFLVSFWISYALGWCCHSRFCFFSDCSKYIGHEQQ